MDLNQKKKKNSDFKKENIMEMGTLRERERERERERVVFQNDSFGN